MILCFSLVDSRGGGRGGGGGGRGGGGWGRGGGGGRSSKSSSKSTGVKYTALAKGGRSKIKGSTLTKAAIVGAAVYTGYQVIHSYTN